jgi:hypothetical protein
MRGMADKTIKVCLTNRGEDSETPWAHDLGPAPPGQGPKGSRRVRLVNVPFLHAKPTWGDVIVVSPVADGFPTWDRDGVAWPKISTRIVEDGGRWAMIIDYTASDADAAYRALSQACERADIVCEGAWGPGDKPGRAYLAVKQDLDATAVMAKLHGAALPCELIQVHPAPAAPAQGASGLGPRASGEKEKSKKPEPKKLEPRAKGPEPAKAKAPEPAKAKAPEPAKAKAKPNGKAAKPKAKAKKRR